VRAKQRETRKPLTGIASWAAQAVCAASIAGGVRILEYTPRMLHAKTAVVDGTCAALGTANLDRGSFFLNYEPVLALRARRLLESTA